jgi:hypothetical protein
VCSVIIISTLIAVVFILGNKVSSFNILCVLHTNTMDNPTLLESLSVEEDIMPICISSNDSSLSSLCRTFISHTIGRVVPIERLPRHSSVEDDIFESFNSHLPYFSWTSLDLEPPFELSFFLLCRLRNNAFKFFYDMVTRWMIPGRSFNIMLFFASDFRFSSALSGEYSVGELKIRVESAEDLALIRNNLSIISSEICQGVCCDYHARRILEIKGLSYDEKTASIHEHISSLLNKRPDDFDLDVFTEMQHILVSCSDDFKKSRSPHNICRIIASHYLFRRSLYSYIEQDSHKRYPLVKVFKANITVDGVVTPVISIIMGINFLDGNEVFSDHHLIRAVQRHLHGVSHVSGSSFVNTRIIPGSSLESGAKRGTLCTMSLEIAKDDKSDFSLEDMRILRRELPDDIINTIEQLMHPLFMPHNEEETMHDIMTLSTQLRYLRDIPQVIITFDKQSRSAFTFSIVMLRVLKKDSVPIKKLFRDSDTFMTFVPDRVKTVGMLRKRYPKEANVFSISLKKRDFLRSDHSLDVAKARRVVVSEMSRIVGDFRDYNGGMIMKQNELLSSLREMLSADGKYNEFLLENFFYSLTPIMARALLTPHLIKTLFTMLIEAIEDNALNKSVFAMKTQDNDDALFVMITTNDHSLKEKIAYVLEPLQTSSLQVISSFIKSAETSYLGYICRGDDPSHRKKLLSLITKL